MSAANRTRIALIREVTFGTTPTTPRMRTERITGESLKYTPKFTNSNELRADRMNADPIKVNEMTDGGINFELSYPEAGSALSERLASLMWNDWVNTPTFDNDGTADSVVTDAGTTANTYVVASGGAAVKVGHLVRATGFTNPANNQIFRAASSTGTTIVGTALSLTAETAPPAAAKLKVVGFQGASADITATAGGLGSTALDFTTLGLVVGQWIKVGGTAAGDQFATALLNDWCRITAIAATALTLDNKPSGWTTDAGTGKTIKVWFGDYIKNGTTRISHSTERGFLDQAVPTYIINRGLVVNSMDLQIQSEREITGTFNVMGLTSAQGTVQYGSTYDAATTNRVMAGSVNVGRIAESGSPIISPNWAQALQLRINNNMRQITAVDSVGAVDLPSGDCEVTGTLNTYFGSNSLYAKLLAGTVGAVNVRTVKDSQAIIIQLPRLTFTEGAPNAQQKNTDVTLPLQLSSSLDTATNAHVWVDRVPYYE